jgi:hypothetical protein
MTDPATDLCACGRPWADVPAGHARTLAFDGTQTCADLSAVDPAAFLAWTADPTLGITP